MRTVFALSALASAALLTSAVAIAQTAPSEPAPVENGAAPVAPPAKEKKICHAPDSTTTRMAKRICKTKAEWDGEAKQNIDKIKRDN